MLQQQHQQQDNIDQKTTSHPRTMTSQQSTVNHNQPAEDQQQKSNNNNHNTTPVNGSSSGITTNNHQQSGGVAPPTNKSSNLNNNNNNQQNPNHTPELQEGSSIGRSSNVNNTIGDGSIRNNNNTDAKPKKLARTASGAWNNAQQRSQGESGGGAGGGDGTAALAAGDFVPTSKIVMEIKQKIQLVTSGQAIPLNFIFEQYQQQQHALREKRAMEQQQRRPNDPIHIPDDKELEQIANRTHTPVPVLRQKFSDLAAKQKQLQVQQQLQNEIIGINSMNINNNNNNNDNETTPTATPRKEKVTKDPLAGIGKALEASKRVPVDPHHNALSPLKIATFRPNGRYVQHQMLGSGSFGELYLCEWVPYDLDVRTEAGDVPPTTFGPGRGPYRLAQGGGGGKTSGASSPVGGTITGINGTLNNGITSPQSAKALRSPGANGGGNPNSQTPKSVGIGNLSRVQSANSFRFGVASNQNSTVNGTLNGTGRISPGTAFLRPQTASANAPAGWASRMSCTKPFIRGANGALIPRDSVFVCKRQRTDKKTTLVSRLGDKPNPLLVAQISEQRILANCAHPCICAFVEEFNDGNSNFLVMEYVDGKDLRHEIERRATAEEPFSEHSVLLLFVQIIMALEYLHRHNILHRDLKSDNVLLSRVWQVKLCDFGLAKQFGEDVDTAVSTTRLGTPSYISPEIFAGHGYSDKADMWSCGVLLYELFNLQLPYTAPTVKDLMKKVIEDPVPPMIRRGASKGFTDLLYNLLQKDPTKRPSAKQALQTPILKKAMDEFVRGYAACARDTKRYDAPIDSVWAMVLLDHMRLVLRDDMSSQKSAIASRRQRAEVVTSNWASKGGGATSRGGGGQSQNLQTVNSMRTLNNQ